MSSNVNLSTLHQELGSLHLFWAFYVLKCFSFAEIGFEAMFLSLCQSKEIIMKLSA